MIWVVIASVLFGINPTLLAASVGRGMDSVCQIFWTSLVNCCVNLLLLLRSEECSGLRLKGRTAAILAGSGILGMGLTGSLLSVSYQLIGTGTSTVIHFMYPAVVSAAAWIFFRKKPGRRKILSILLSVCGVALMAQVGSFVPAQSANICISDRIFTRVGASDDLASGQSTFMVEMTEVANILRNATSKSLLILDEIGRGTSTFDGLSIAWAVVEYISDSRLLGAKTLFATHYHELTELEGKISNVNNYCIAVKEKGDDIVFLRKIVKGGADKSYGIQVAKLAGVPDLVINRAKEIVEELAEEDITSRVSEIAEKEHKSRKRPKPKKYDEVDIAQMSLFDTVKDDDVLEELKNIDVGNLTPIDALNTIYRLQNKLKNRW